MKSYFVAQIKFRDRKMYQKYLDNFDDVFNLYKGEVIVVDDNPEVLEGKWEYSRIVIIKFPDVNEARNWYYSLEYQEILRFRQQGADADIVLVEGKI